MPMTPHGAFFWNELMTWSVEKAKGFYGETLDWQYVTHPMADGGTYTICKSGEAMVAGIFEMKPNTGFDGVPDHWFAYIAVDDIDARLAGVEAAGGEISSSGLRRARRRPLRRGQGQRRRLHRLGHPYRAGVAARGGARSTTRSSSAPAVRARPPPCSWPARATACCCSTAIASPATWGSRRT